MPNPKLAVALIVVAELFGTSLWFSANAAAPGLARQWGLDAADVGALTNAVQFGFITGTLTFSLTGWADRFAASRWFCASALLGAATNAAFGLLASDLHSALIYRFLTGLTLAGIYPLGMKLVFSWAPKQAGQTLAWLVGMLTLGTALPQGVRALGSDMTWTLPVMTASGAALLAAGLVFMVGDGPHLPKGKAAPKQVGEALAVFRLPKFRAAALGYFGHMWELYAFWTLVPFLLTTALREQRAVDAATVPTWSFAVIAIGSVGCVLGGLCARKVGSAKVAALALAGSAAACLLFPFIQHGTAALVLLLFWGLMVVADSPQFSALSARHCPPDRVGSALAVQNGIGFSISVVAIALTTSTIDTTQLYVAWLLLPGPLLGLVGLLPLLRENENSATTT